jgi:hypothetical protein
MNIHPHIYNAHLYVHLHEARVYMYIQIFIKYIHSNT